MQLKSIILTNLRNHKNTHIEFSGGLNVLFGRNGAGKTTILEAIAISGFSKSFLPVADVSLIKSGENFYSVAVSAENDLGIPYKVNVYFASGQRKRLTSSFGDNLTPKDIIGELPQVILSPDFKNITFGSPLDRRYFLDRILSQASKLYLENLLNLKKCLKQRNNLLQKAETDLSFNYSLVEPWTNLLIKTASDIIEKRHRFIQDFIPYFQSTYKDISGDSEPVSFEYMPNGVINLHNNNISKEYISECLNNQALRLQKAELARGTTLFGPQKDEVRISINGGIAREFASQGQHKSLLISIKFAEFNFLKNIKQETPVVLLDDIFSELDDKRSEKVIELVTGSKAQTIITVTNPSILSWICSPESSCSYFKIEGGEVSNYEL